MGSVTQYADTSERPPYLTGYKRTKRYGILEGVLDSDFRWIC